MCAATLRCVLRQLDVCFFSEAHGYRCVGKAHTGVYNAHYGAKFFAMVRRGGGLEMVHYGTGVYQTGSVTVHTLGNRCGTFQFVVHY